MPSPLFSQERAPTSVAYAELQSMFLDSLVRDLTGGRSPPVGTARGGGARQAPLRGAPAARHAGGALLREGALRDGRDRAERREHRRARRPHRPTDPGWHGRSAAALGAALALRRP
eukprot:scaffold29570_cov57-Phaeocystis_antarctica.AAC.2